MLNTYEHGFSDGLRDRQSILNRGPDYEKGWSAGHRYRRRDMHLTSALFVILIIFGTGSVVAGLLT